jgi:hypothetical protein
VFVVSFPALFSSELSFKLVNGHINAPVGILACFGANKNLAVLGFRDNLHARVATLVAVYNHLNSIDTIVILGKLGSLCLGMASDSFGYFDMFAADSKKQDHSP